MAEDIEMQRMPNSRALAAAGYDLDTRRLRVEFEHGGIYDYLDVEPEVFLGLLDSAHPWTEWGAHIKSTYAVDPVG